MRQQNRHRLEEPEASRGARSGRARRTSYRRHLPASARRIVRGRVARRWTRRLEATTRTPSRREDWATSPSLLVRREARRQPPRTRSSVGCRRVGTPTRPPRSDPSPPGRGERRARRTTRRRRKRRQSPRAPIDGNTTPAAANRPQSRRASGCRAMASTVTVCAGVNLARCASATRPNAASSYSATTRARGVANAASAAATTTPPEGNAAASRGSSAGHPPVSAPAANVAANISSQLARGRRARRAERRVQHGARREGGTPSAEPPRRRRAHAPGDGGGTTSTPRRAGRDTRACARARCRGAFQGARVRAAGGWPRARTVDEGPRRRRRRRISTVFRVARRRAGRLALLVRGGASRSNRLPHRLVVLLSRCRPRIVASHARASCPGVTRAG